MILVLQRSLSASISVDNTEIASIKKGLVIFAGIEKGDTFQVVEKICTKIIQLRIFADAQNKMNLSLNEIKGEILAISQFTLCADLNKGNRPSFTRPETPEVAVHIYNQFVQYLKQSYIPEKVHPGIFGADMQINLTNDGPVTFILNSQILV